MSKPFAIVTGASSGIGLELAAICAREGLDLLVAADRPEILAAQRYWPRLTASAASPPRSSWWNPIWRRRMASIGSGLRLQGGRSMHSSPTAA
jgi:NAD(P)-dependent dehydrogenase (short-subunit alcohol dehydrogenase family)